MARTNTRRRWASRRPRPSPKRFSKRKYSSGQRAKAKLSHKLRLVRRYIRRKLDDSKPHTNLKHLQSASSISEARTKAIPATKASVPILHNDVAADRKTTSRPAVIAEVTAIPNPLPDSGITAAVVSTAAVAAGSPLLGGATFNSVTSGLSIVYPALNTPFTSTALHAAAAASFSPLPPLDSLIAPTSASTVGVRPAELPTQTRPSASTSPSAASTESQSRQLSAAMVILVSVGSALLLLGFCIVVKMCHKPRRKARPTPSLPILKEAEADEDYYETKESPLFGGAERMSAANGPMWNWVQYPHTKLSGPTAGPPLQNNYASQYSTQQNPISQNQAYNLDPGQAESRFHLATHPPSSTAPSTSSQAPESYIPRAAYHNVPPVPSKRASRQSFYAPQSNTEAPTENTRQETDYTADGHDILKRTKGSNRRQSQLGTDDWRKRNSTVSFVGLAYDGEDAASPVPIEYGHVIQETPNSNSDHAGRARVKSGYFAVGTYPRMSTLPSASYSIATATRINVAQRNSFSKDKLQKGNSKRIRDTQALTYALGLASPRTEYGVASPQPTIYPEDSLSVRPKKGERKPVEEVPDVPVIVPMNNVGSSDTLMGMSFGVSQMSLTGLDLEPVSESSGESSSRQAEAGSGSASSSNSSIQVQIQGPSRVMDKAPRVPSPPALPSLAQMGLARSNPEAYDNYRSPTYSLYGLYQTADRKSFMGR
ncbi:hypothetical protein BDN70DRAFT_872277 [Pholiota conissans]|uniref:Transmembrane protein n=1 Tax=Pholiota conissans TaxID=109636 RepID=A0A9P6CY16_9AGAR|nr:hypothetical protein BDN70DRAFT_872277 [Pholiota conissans]